MSYREQLDLSRIPRHVAIIMDGNGRWAQQRGFHRNRGHQEGVEAVKKVTEECVAYILSLRKTGTVLYQKSVH